MSAPKAFISYSWSSPDHEAWVLQLATDLVDNGIDVIIDKWNLREGHDANAFMEQMATNDEIKKVLLICDRAYKEKADGRKGGAGTEAQIITPQIYASQDQNKFVAVLSERDEDGRPIVPAFYASRIFIDLSDPTTSGSKFEELVRWVYNKPLHVKPSLGKPPAYISDDREVVRLGTSTHQKRAIEAIRSGRANAPAIVGEYFSKFLEEMQNFRLTGINKSNFEDEIFQNIDDFLPYRNEIYELIAAVAVFMPTPEIISKVHKFLEGTISYMYPSEHMHGGTSWDFDNYRFLAYEMYLGILSILIRHEQFDAAATIINTEFYVGNIRDIDSYEMMGPEVFIHHLGSFEAANQKSATRKYTKIGDVLHGRSKHTYFEYRHLCTADMILYLRGLSSRAAFVAWNPVTQIYLQYSRSSLELFSRCRSRKYFEKIKTLLGVNSPEEFRILVSTLESRGGGGFGGNHFHRISLSTLVNAENIATAP